MDATLEVQPPPSSAAPAAVIPPTPEEIDGVIANYEVALKMTQDADRLLAGMKERLIFLVDHFGAVPAHAEQSKRISGRHHEATITFSTSYTVIEQGVTDLHDYLKQHALEKIFPRFFVAQIKHKLVDGARDVLRTMEMPKRVSERIAALVGLAIDVKTAAPSLKVKTVQPEKPARKPRGGKAGA